MVNHESIDDKDLKRRISPQKAHKQRNAMTAKATRVRHPGKTGRPWPEVNASLHTSPLMPFSHSLD